MRKAFERILLHLGPPKSGATSIQHFLANNRSVLEKRGIYVPSVMRRGAQHVDLPLLFGPRREGWNDWRVGAAKALGVRVAVPS